MNHTILRRTLGAALILLAAASIYLSWGALYEFATAAGFPPERAIVFPIILDVVTIVAMLTAISIDHARAFSWSVLALFGTATIIGNSLHTLTIPENLLTLPLPVAIIAASIPPISLLVTVHLAAVTVFRPQHHRTVTTTVAPDTDRRPQVIQLHNDGHTLAHIARETNVPRSTVVRWVKAA